MSNTAKQKLIQAFYTELRKTMEDQPAEAAAEKMAAIIEQAAQTLAEVIPLIIEAITVFTNRFATPDMVNLMDAIAAANVPTPKKPKLLPPKYIGPANKAQYTANNPPRRTRSNC